MGPSSDLSREKPALLDPCQDNPEQHILLQIDGKVEALDGSERGSMTILLFDLNKQRRVELRLRAIQRLWREYKCSGAEGVELLLKEDTDYPGLLRGLFRRLTNRTDFVTNMR